MSKQEPTDAESAHMLRAAIAFTLDMDDGINALLWLEDWFYGEPSAMHELESYMEKK